MEIGGEDAKPFVASLKSHGDASRWEVKPIEDIEMERLKECLDANMSIRDIADEMGKSKSTIHRMEKNLKRQ